MEQHVAAFDPNSDDWLMWGRSFYRQVFLQQINPLLFAVHIYSNDPGFPKHRLSKKFPTRRHAEAFMERALRGPR